MGKTAAQILLAGAFAHPLVVLVHRNAAQPDRLAIQKDLGSARLDATEADAVAQLVLACGHDQVVKARAVGRPEIGHGVEHNLAFAILEHDLARKTEFG